MLIFGEEEAIPRCHPLALGQSTCGNDEELGVCQRGGREIATVNHLRWFSIQPIKQAELKCARGWRSPIVLDDPPSRRSAVQVSNVPPIISSPSCLPRLANMSHDFTLEEVARTWARPSHECLCAMG
jgi:hypothetical protein